VSLEALADKRVWIAPIDLNDVQKLETAFAERVAAVATDIIGGSVVRITAAQSALLGVMIAKLQNAIQVKLREIVPD